jgi:hypothetical protein
MLSYSLAQDSGFQLGSRGSSSQPTSLSLLDMLKAYAVGFYQVALALQEMRSEAEIRKDLWKEGIDEFAQRKFRTLLASIKQECATLELKHTLSMTQGIESKFLARAKFEKGSVFGIGSAPYTYVDLSNDLETINMSFSNELQEELIFRIASGKTGFFEKDDLFGPGVSNAFPSAVDNIRNAGTCFAVEQWDACVFHLMRVLERGLRVMAIRFSVSFQNATWNTIIQDIETSIRGINPSVGADWREQRTFYSEAARHFRFLKDAWRNHIMHLGDVYDEGKALSVLRGVHELMQTLAKGGLHE